MRKIREAGVRVNPKAGAGIHAGRSHPRRIERRFRFRFRWRLPSQSYSVVLLDRFAQLDLVEILDADLLRLANKVRVDIRSIPVRVGDPIVRACRNQQLVLTAGTSGGALAELVVIEREAAFEPAVQVRIRLLPWCPIS